MLTNLDKCSLGFVCGFSTVNVLVYTLIRVGNLRPTWLACLLFGGWAVALGVNLWLFLR